jgi:hypothetical protein
LGCGFTLREGPDRWVSTGEPEYPELEVLKDRPGSNGGARLERVDAGVVAVAWVDDEDVDVEDDVFA